MRVWISARAEHDDASTARACLTALLIMYSVQPVFVLCNPAQASPTFIIILYTRDSK